MRRSKAWSGAILISCLGLAWLAPATALAKSADVTICHVPPANPQNAHTIAINPSAVAAHLAHGDYLGECRPRVCTPGATVSCYGGPAGTPGVGVCQEGTQTCNAAGTAFGPCTGEVVPSVEACGDGLDNDCDGVIDNGCVCVPGSTTTCYDGPGGTEGVGACHAGIQTCDATGTGYGACAGQVTPSAEVCGDGIDNDCDGVVDEGCVCTPGSSAPCYTGPAGTAGVGACQAGTHLCNATGTAYEACLGSVTPADEICGDGIDNDCNGTVDDGCFCTAGSPAACYDGPSGTAGIGVCQAGVMICNATGTAYGACTGQVTPSSETCGDSLDNDCDGTSDETCVCTPSSTAACYSGPPSTEDIGICTSGTMTCAADGSGYGACVGETLPTSEVCGDGVDNDCDGVSDENCVCLPLTTAPCYGGPGGTEGVGACHTGVQTCNATGTGYGACVGDVIPSAEICGDGVDNDCDGSIDEGCVGDRAWHDTNGNGVQDAGEPGLAGALFLLRNASTDGLVAVTTSDALGAYVFSNVPPGFYYVEVNPPSGYVLTSPDAGGNDALDSDFDDESFVTSTFVLSAGTFDIDCGFKTEPAF